MLFQAFKQRFQSIPPVFFHLLSVLGAGVYLAQSIHYAMHLPPILDEASYLLKGYLFASGRYRPFQYDGPWINKMPLSFLIPGWAQQLTEPGLRTGRVFAVILGCLILLGVWLLIRRTAGHRWAAFSVLTLALTPALIKTYSQLWSQVIVSAILIWMLVCLLGKDRRPWQIFTGAALSAVLVLVRENMVFVSVFAMLYIWWEHGKQPGFTSVLIFGTILLYAHLLYYPNILDLWFSRLPDLFQDRLRERFGLSRSFYMEYPNFSPSSRFYAAWDGIRMNFAYFVSLTAAWILYPWKRAARDDPNFKSILFLSVSLLVMIPLHFQSSVLGSYCIYCFNNYLHFFILLVIPLFCFSVQRWHHTAATMQQIFAVIASAGIIPFFFAGEQFNLAVSLLDLQVPRVRNLRLQEGSIEFWRLIVNKFGMDYQTQLVPAAKTIFMIILFALSLIIVLWAYQRIRRQPAPGVRAGTLILTAVLGISWLLSPTPVLSAGRPVPDCGNVIVNMEAIGAHLDQTLPPDQFIYYTGGAPSVIFLYLEDAVFPPQLINHDNGLRVGENQDEFRKFGQYNLDMKLDWMRQADYALILGSEVTDFESLSPNLNQLSQLTPTQPICTSDETTRIYIYRNQQSK
ncbi:MAG: glycosyltransferase family 39 protein [Anaerolineaceae bacterium]|nr:glycosyltransferase family 39 protein [Anaerolineaceae bacterium]